MSLNRKELEKRMNAAASQLLEEKGYVAFVDVLMRMDKLSKEDYERWRCRRVPFLEKVVTGNRRDRGELLDAMIVGVADAGAGQYRAAHREGPTTGEMVPYST